MCITSTGSNVAHATDGSYRDDCVFQFAAYHCRQNYYMQSFSVFRRLPVIQAAGEIPTGINIARDSRGAFALQRVKGCVVT